MDKPTVKKGDRGEAVKRLQRILNSKQYLLLPSELLKVDGVFGLATESALKRFQKLKGLKVDGVVGSKTWQQLNKDESVD